ncbi:hypothetical protein GCM10007906_32490 [Vibrio hyugaensis]|uniref:Uncharacterized protein n=1 Tax=Vibrio hyugaensis TaxID=1534743 RepID=A0ABQ5Y3Y4_9VIBR|nr:hypothetical protein GCM10007906_32490 [Vibrio hyugaensis]
MLNTYVIQVGCSTILKWERLTNLKSLSFTFGIVELVMKLSKRTTLGYDKYPLVNVAI